MDGSLITWDGISESAGGCRWNQQAKYAFDGSVDGEMYASGRWNAVPQCETSSRGCASLTMTKTDNVKVSRYEWVTGRDRNGDPISWKLEARNSEEDPWTTLDEQVQYDVPSSTKATIGPFNVAGINQNM